MAGPHIEKAKHQRYETGLDVEPPGQAKEGRHHANGTELETTGEDRPGQETLERSCAWPMLQEEPRA